MGEWTQCSIALFFFFSELLMECMDSSSKVQKFVSNVRSELKMSNSLTAEH